MAQVLADAKDTNPAEAEEMLGNPKAANSALGNGKGSAKFMDAYRQFIAEVSRGILKKGWE